MNLRAKIARRKLDEKVAPHSFHINLKRLASKDAVAILDVPVVTKRGSLMGLRRLRSPLALNHVNFFTKDSLRLNAKCAGWEVPAVRPFIFENELVESLISPVAPHLYLVARNKRDFKCPPKKMYEWEGGEYYKDLLSITNQYK